MVPGAAIGIERRGRGIRPDAHGAALVRRRPPVERLREHDRIAGGAQSLLEGLDEPLMGAPVAAPPVEPDLAAFAPSRGFPGSGRSSLIAYQSTERLLMR